MTGSASILFVCLGNICRSPMAEGAMRAAAARAGLDIGIDSCGTAAYHVGEPPDPRAIACAAGYGVDISGLRGRQLTIEDFRSFTHIFALDESNLSGVLAREPQGGIARVSLLMDVVPGRAGEPVRDPYYGGAAGFEATWADVTAAADAILANLRDGRW